MTFRAAALTVALLAAVVAGVRASPSQGACAVITDAGAQGPATKTCSQCQWDCLTNTHDCNSITFDGVSLPFSSLATWNCGDGHWLGAADSPGLCVLYDMAGAVYDTQEQGCIECLHQCKGDTHCSKVVYNYETLLRDAVTCTPPPPSPIITPSPIIAPSPKPPSPSPEPSDVGGEYVLRCVETGGVAALPVPSAAQGTCNLYDKDGNVLTSTTITCEQCQFHCLTWGTSHSDCAAMSYAGSSKIAREDLVDGLCPASAAAANAAPLNDNTYGVCVLMNAGLVQDTQMMHCFTCVEQCKTWGPGACDTMIFNTKVVAHADLDTACECNNYVVEEKTEFTTGSPIPLQEGNRVPSTLPPATNVNPDGTIEVPLPGMGRRLLSE